MPSGATSEVDERNVEAACGERERRGASDTPTRTGNERKRSHRVVFIRLARSSRAMIIR